MGSKHGGKRKRSGRKPVDDKKIAVTLYVRQSRVTEIGIDNLKKQCYDLIG